MLEENTKEKELFDYLITQLKEDTADYFFDLFDFWEDNLPSRIYKKIHRLFMKHFNGYFFKELVNILKDMEKAKYPKRKVPKDKFIYMIPIVGYSQFKHSFETVLRKPITENLIAESFIVPKVYPLQIYFYFNREMKYFEWFFGEDSYDFLNICQMREQGYKLYNEDYCPFIGVALNIEELNKVVIPIEISVETKLKMNDFGYYFSCLSEDIHKVRLYYVSAIDLIKYFTSHKNHLNLNFLTPKFTHKRKPIYMDALNLRKTYFFRISALMREYAKRRTNIIYLDEKIKERKLKLVENKNNKTKKEVETC